MTTQHTHESNSQIPLRFARNIQERFEDFDRENPSIYAYIVAKCFELERMGFRHYGMRGIWEIMRHHFQVERKLGEAFKLCDHYPSRYVRKLIVEYPQFEHLFELRKLRAK